MKVTFSGTVFLDSRTHCNSSIRPAERSSSTWQKHGKATVENGRNKLEDISNLELDRLNIKITNNESLIIIFVRDFWKILNFETCRSGLDYLLFTSIY